MSCVGGWCQREGEEVGKGCRRVNTMQILCTVYVNGKMVSVKLFQEGGSTPP
jgi:hypothetical protein